MAITAINITKDNTDGSCNLVAVHSPLVFLLQATYTGLAAPDYLYCQIFDENGINLTSGTVFEPYKAIFYSDLLAGERLFYFVADEILRGFMENFDDALISTNSITLESNATKIFKLKFFDPINNLIFDEVTINAMHAAKYIGEKEAMTSIYNNDDEVIFAFKNMPFYSYFFNDNITNVLTYTIV